MYHNRSLVPTRPAKLLWIVLWDTIRICPQQSWLPLGWFQIMFCLFMSFCTTSNANRCLDYETSIAKGRWEFELKKEGENLSSPHLGKVFPIYTPPTPNPLEIVFWIWRGKLVFREWDQGNMLVYLSTCVVPLFGLGCPWHFCASYLRKKRLISHTYCGMVAKFKCNPNPQLG